MKLKSLLSIGFLLMAFTALAAELPTLTPTEENSILKAQHDVDGFSVQLKDMESQYSRLKAQEQQLEQVFPQVQQQMAEAQKKLDAAQDAAIKAHGLDKAKTALDLATLKFKDKTPAPAPATPAKP